MAGAAVSCRRRAWTHGRTARRTGAGGAGARRNGPSYRARGSAAPRTRSIAPAWRPLACGAAAGRSAVGIGRRTPSCAMFARRSHDPFERVPGALDAAIPSARAQRRPGSDGQVHGDRGPFARPPRNPAGRQPPRRRRRPRENRRPGEARPGQGRGGNVAAFQSSSRGPPVREKAAARRRARPVLFFSPRRANVARQPRGGTVHERTDRKIRLV